MFYFIKYIYTNKIYTQKISTYNLKKKIYHTFILNAELNLNVN